MAVSDTLVLGVNETPLRQSPCDALILPVFQDGEMAGNLAAVDESLAGLLADMRARHEFTGEANQVAILPTLGRLPAARVALIGLGKQADCTLNSCRLAMM